MRHSGSSASTCRRSRRQSSPYPRAALLALLWRRKPAPDGLQALEQCSGERNGMSASSDDAPQARDARRVCALRSRGTITLLFALLRKHPYFTERLNEQDEADQRGACRSSSPVTGGDGLSLLSVYTRTGVPTDTQRNSCNMRTRGHRDNPSPPVTSRTASPDAGVRWQKL